MVDGDQVREWAPRLLAPVAFFVAATVLVLVVHRALNTNSSATANPSGPTVAEPGTTVSQPTTSTQGGISTGRRFYRVRPGDTLDAIAARFKTTTADLVILNPRIDPLSLSVGQRIRIR